MENQVATNVTQSITRRNATSATLTGARSRRRRLLLTCTKEAMLSRRAWLLKS